VLFLAGMLLMAYNVLRTAAGAEASDARIPALAGGGLVTPA
jgi:cbb3-type cytochrome oxidase subunit 1